MDLPHQLSTLTPRLNRLLESRWTVQTEPLPFTRLRTLQKQVRLSAEQVQTMAADYQSGMTVEQLAKSYGIHRTTVMIRLEQAGVPRRHSGGSV